MLGSKGCFPLLARYLVQQGGNLADSSERDRLLYWYIHTFLWGRYSGSTESMLNKDLEAIETAARESANDGLDRLIEGLRQVRGDLRLNETDFRGSSRGIRFYPLLYMMTRVCHAKDWGTGDELTNHLLGHLASLQVHHMFPKALLYKHGYERREVNAIANFTFLTQETNLQVSDRDPAEYIPVYEARNPGTVASHWIPMDPELWKVENYQDFLEARRKLLAATANAFLDKLVAGAVPETAGEVSVVDRTSPVVLGGVEDEEEERTIRECSEWVIAQGLPEGEFGFEIADEKTGECLAVFDLAWPNGIQEKLSQPVVVLLNKGSETMAIASQAGYRCFTATADFQRYVQAEILAQETPA